jgi:hypothetical protein
VSVRQGSGSAPGPRLALDGRGARWARALVIGLASVPVALAADRLTSASALHDGAGRNLVAALAAGCAAVLVAAIFPAARTMTLILVLALVQLSEQAMLLLVHIVTGQPTGCLPAVGRGAHAGFELALVHRGQTCPQGTYAAAPTLTGAWTAVGIAALLVAVHAVAATLIGLLIAIATASLIVIGVVLAVCLPRLPRPVAITVRGWRNTASRAHEHVLSEAAVCAPRQRRGPPVLARA